LAATRASNKTSLLQECPLQGPQEYTSQRRYMCYRQSETKTRD